MNRIDVRGDITFYRNKKGERFQSIGCMDDRKYPVKKGKKTVYITSYGEYRICYHLNGQYGYVAYKDDEKIFDGVWSLEEVFERLDKEI